MGTPRMVDGVAVEERAMPDESDFGITELVRTLPRAIQAAVGDGQEDGLRYRVELKELELGVAETRPAEGDAGGEIGVFSSSVKGFIAREDARTVELAPKPDSSSSRETLVCRFRRGSEK